MSGGLDYAADHACTQYANVQTQTQSTVPIPPILRESFKLATPPILRESCKYSAILSRDITFRFLASYTVQCS